MKLWSLALSIGSVRGNDENVLLVIGGADNYFDLQFSEFSIGHNHGQESKSYQGKNQQ